MSLNSEKDSSAVINTDIYKDMVTLSGLQNCSSGDFVIANDNLVSAFYNSNSRLPQKFLEKWCKTSPDGDIRGKLIAGLVDDKLSRTWLALILFREEEVKNQIVFAQNTYAISSMNIGDYLEMNEHGDYLTRFNESRYVPKNDFLASLSSYVELKVYNTLSAQNDTSLSCVAKAVNLGLSYVKEKVS